MPSKDPSLERFNLHRKINRAHARLLAFTMKYAHAKRPLTEAEEKRHKVLFDRWMEAVKQLQQFEG